MKLRSLLFLAIWLLPVTVFSQIFEPNGLRMPGDWNGWVNTLDMGGDFDLTKISTGTPRWTTTFQFTGETAVQNFKFVTNDFDNVWGHQWVETDFQPDLTTDLAHTQDGSKGNNTILATKDKWYTVNWKDNGYSSTRAIFMETSAEPVEIVNVSGIPENSIAKDESVTITVELDKVKSAEELVYLRYSTDGFQTSDAVLVNGLDASITGTAEIPAQALNSKVEFYALSTTVEKESWAGEADLVTIRFNNNENANYHYFYETTISPINDATDISITPELKWYSISDTSLYHLQVDDNQDFSSPEVDIQDLSDTLFTITEPLEINTDYYWRFAHSDSIWSDVFNFRTESKITFAKIQFPETVVIDEGNPAVVYGRVYIPEISGIEGENSNVKAWLGVNPDDTDPSTWDEDSWEPAAYNVDAEENDDDEYQAQISDTIQAGRYFYAFRYQYKNQDFVYGGFNGFWNGAENYSGKLHIRQVPQPLTPANDAADLDTKPAFEWTADDDLIQSYHFQLAGLSDFTEPVLDESNVTDKTYTPIEDLAGGSTYYWRVRANYDTTSSGWSEVFSFATKIELPETVILSAPAKDAADISTLPVLEWNASTAADSYELQLHVEDDFSDTSALVLNISDITSASYELSELQKLENGREYFWRVRAVNAAGTGPWSETHNFITVAPVANLLTPEDGSENQPTDLDLTWEEAEHAISYQVQIAEDAAFENILKDSVGIIDQKLSLENLSNSQTYYWRVKANYKSVSSDWPDAFSFKVIDDIPGIPELIAPDSGAVEVALLPAFSWNEVNYADDYHLQVSASEDFDSLSTTTFEAAETNFTIENPELEPGTQYFWRVKAGNESGYGEWSAANNFFTIAPTPDLISPENGAQNLPTELTLEWEELNHAHSYDLIIAEDSAFSTVFADTAGLTEAAFSISYLQFNQSYFWKVRANYSDQSGDWSAVYSFTVKSAIPLTPQLLSPADEAINVELSTTLIWENAADAETYNIQLSTDPDFTELLMDSTGLVSTEIAAPALIKNTSYYWRVRAVNSSGESDWSETYSFTTKPEVPDNVTLIFPANEQKAVPVPVQLKWNKAAGAEKYQFQFSEDENFNFKMDSLISDTTFLIDDISAGKSYYWRVRATNGGGFSAWASTFTFTTGIGGSPAPQLLTPENNAANQADEITFKWEESALADEYRLQISKDETFNSADFDTLTTSVELELSGFEKETFYYWRLKAFDEGGETLWSEIFSFATEMEIPATPEPLLPDSGTDKVSVPITLKWTKSEKATNYEIQLSEVSDFTVSMDSIIYDTTITLSALNNNTTYFWKVRAANGSGKSEWSETFSFTTITALPAVPELIHPDDQEEISGSVRLAWNHAERAESYTIHLAETETFDELIVNVPDVEDDFLEVPLPEEEKTYFWRVKAVNSGGESNWSDTLSFSTKIPVSTEKEFLPDAFSLYQNYPNPFNPSTTIRYDVKYAGNIRIQIFDVNGRLVSTLVDEHKSAGRYSIRFDAANLSSGVYFTRMMTKGFVSSKAMILLK